jgi:S-adenosylmethionine hydrolase
MRRDRSGIVTLITDFGWGGEYVGAMKGAILRVNPSCQVVDLTHQVEPQNILQAAYILRNTYSFFPPGTVHLAVVDPGVGSRRKAVAVKTGGHLFVSPDNGILSGILEGKKKAFGYEIKDRKYFLSPVSDTFHGRDIFAPVAGHLSLGLDPSRLGPQIQGLRTIALPRPRKVKGGLTARILWADSFGNLITNLARREYGRALETRPFQIKGKGWKIDRVCRTYGEGLSGRPMALFGSGGFLEISMNRGNARNTLGLEPGESIIILWR